jgi:hypothetical protein
MREELLTNEGSVDHIRGYQLTVSAHIFLLESFRKTTTTGSKNRGKLWLLFFKKIKRKRPLQKKLSRYFSGKTKKTKNGPLKKKRLP